MSPAENEIVTRKVVLDLPGMDDVIVRRDGAIDVYHPANVADPATVIIVAGYPDAGFQKIFGRSFREMQSTVCWARLIAASGMQAIAYSNQDPVADLNALIAKTHATRVGLWASSGNVPLALSRLMRPTAANIKCGAFCYPLTLDLDGQTGVADAAKLFRFVNPASGKTIDDVADDVPMFLARAGADEVPRLNETLDRFVAAALARDLPITVVNHPGAPHAFDLFHDSETARQIIRQLLAFLRFHLQ